MAGVAPSTVSRALSGSPLIPKETADKIKEIADKAGYRPNMLARKLASNRSFQIGLVTPLGVNRSGAFHASYFSGLLDSMVGAALPANYHMTIMPYRFDEPDIPETLHAYISEKNVDGLILAGLKQDSDIPARLADAEVPFILIGSKPENDEIITINCNPRPAIRSMLELLRSKSYRKLVFVAGDMDYYDAQRQKDCLVEELKDFDIKVSFMDGNYTRRSGYAAAKELFSRNITADTAVFLANDRMAGGFYRYCYENDIKIPERVAVIGCDDDDAARVLFPELSTIHQPRREMGQLSVETLLQVFAGKKIAETSFEMDEYFIQRASI